LIASESTAFDWSAFEQLTSESIVYNRVSTNGKPATSARTECTIRFSLHPMSRMRSQNCFEDIPPRRADLAMFPGSENPVKCKGCHVDMDTMPAFCGERVGLEIVRRPDPDH
jgi:hypothetical protein